MGIDSNVRHMVNIDSGDITVFVVPRPACGITSVRLIYVILLQPYACSPRLIVSIDHFTGLVDTSNSFRMSGQRILL
jgi:hypothetical protein